MCKLQWSDLIAPRTCDVLRVFAYLFCALATAGDQQAEMNRAKAVAADAEARLSKAQAQLDQEPRGSVVAATTRKVAAPQGGGERLKRLTAQVKDLESKVRLPLGRGVGMNSPWTSLAIDAVHHMLSYLVPLSVVLEVTQGSDRAAVCVALYAVVVWCAVEGSAQQG